jgi:hypothetical protein
MVFCHRIAYYFHTHNFYTCLHFLHFVSGHQRAELAERASPVILRGWGRFAVLKT